MEVKSEEIITKSDLAATKTGTFDKDNNVLKYTITVESKYGTDGEKVKLHDVLTPPDVTGLNVTGPENVTVQRTNYHMTTEHAYNYPVEEGTSTLTDGEFLYEHASEGNTSPEKYAGKVRQTGRHRH